MASNNQRDELPYQPKDTIGATIKTTLITTSAGAFVSSIQSTLTKQNVGMLAVFTKTGGTIAVFGAMGGAYQFAKCASANLRRKDDPWNSALGGFAAGSMIGLKFRTTPSVFGYGAGLAILLGAFDYTGGALTGYKRDPKVDEVTRKELLRQNRRRSPEETLEELGEGRGVFPPGYAERRAERLKEAYGYTVPTTPVSAAP